MGRPCFVESCALLTFSCQLPKLQVCFLVRTSSCASSVCVTRRHTCPRAIASSLNNAEPHVSSAIRRNLLNAQHNHIDKRLHARNCSLLPLTHLSRKLPPLSGRTAQFQPVPGHAQPTSSRPLPDPAKAPDGPPHPGRTPEASP